MQPMQRPKIKRGILELAGRYGAQLTIRVSLDHYTRALHEAERGARTWERTLAGLDWLSANGVRMAIAGRTCWNESEADTRAGYARLIAERGWRIDAADPAALVLLPEMDGKHDVPEITTRCWAILKKSPGDMMCASSRMVVKRRGEARPTVVPCTLIPYDPAFDMGSTLRGSRRRRRRHVRRGGRQALPPALLEVLRARRRQLLVSPVAVAHGLFLHQRVADLLEVDLGRRRGRRGLLGFRLERASCSSLIPFTSANTAAATIRKLITLLRKLPMLMVTASVPAAAARSGILMSGEVDAAEHHADRRHQHVLDQRLHDGAEGAADDDADGHVDDVALDGEFFELSQDFHAS